LDYLISIAIGPPDWSNGAAALAIAAMLSEEECNAECAKSYADLIFNLQALYPDEHNFGRYSTLAAYIMIPEEFSDEGSTRECANDLLDFPYA
jgi:hypothetical protein